MTTITPESILKLSPIAIYESLLTRNHLLKDITPAAWNEFAKYINIEKINESLSKTNALSIINNYLKTAEFDDLQKVCSFFRWKSVENLQEYINESWELLQNVYANPSLVKNIIDMDVAQTKMKKIELTLKQFVALEYGQNEDLNCIHISLSDSKHRNTSGDFVDFTEIAFLTDSIAFNLDTHPGFDDTNGYNDYYDLYVTNKDYDFYKYKSIAESIVFFRGE